ncbi:TetR/AcrR family transcriptional regulator [Shouchella clausii]|uniref:TetR/AcrR family transcriptional regulator n=3 Tax=Shouchella TaxID=2893057 RepID=A0ABZ2CTT3_9BACI|nr:MULTISPECIES: TetR/AcrR family transcriptional regulator [Shouchella]MBU3230540.1 TetR/AcrR family transcriptional regulator [Shouchella clausii]MBU3262261.1 TetR/AcrR family transcriptional regulator [Shouchella clausii]MBU3507424.1 TetR/AcrR family transcriptional regulator [Shouchella clausii]MBU3535926.1 TetR/AcrR family transcriptional regulator [Shouchella clausii]MBX0306191.1 TetR/AcrR family transcriptional regulator [Shouchella clausii]
MEKLTSGLSQSQKSIMQAVATLLEKEQLKNLTITKVCKEAGVARITFYKYYDTINDVIEATAHLKVSELFMQFSNNTIEDLDDFINGLTLRISRSKSSIKNMLDLNMSHILLVHFIYATKVYLEKSNLKVTRTKLNFFAGGIFNVISEWVRDDLSLEDELRGQLIEIFEYMRVLSNE